MREWKSQSHVKWYCKYHIVFSPKYRKKAMFGSLRKGGKILRELCNQSGVELVEGHASEYCCTCVCDSTEVQRLAYTVIGILTNIASRSAPKAAAWHDALPYSQRLRL